MRNIIQDLPCLEVEAGHGLITSELTKLGADAIATDRHFPDESRYGFRNPLCVMTKLDAVSAVTQLPRPGLIWSGLSWNTTPPKSSTPSRATTSATSARPTTAAGATPEFHDILDNKFRIVDSICIPQYPNHHDRVYHFTRKP